jgi:hypothetical protein
VPPDVHYPDLAPPAGWPYFRQDLQIRIVPPGTTPDSAEATIVVSPLVPRQATTPPPGELIEEALFHEERERFEIVSRKGPDKVKAASGLEGVAVEVVGFVRPRSPHERRLYVMYGDEICLYAVSYLAWDRAFDRYVEAFRETARSVRPFRGTLLHPTGQSPVALLYRD